MADECLTRDEAQARAEHLRGQGGNPEVERIACSARVHVVRIDGVDWKTQAHSVRLSAA